MKKISKLIAVVAIASTLLFIGNSFKSSTTHEVTNNKLGMIEFKITNNTSAEFKYCVNGGHNYISSGSTKGFNYNEGQEFYYIENSNCGKLWFKVTSSMSGKGYNVTDLK